MWPNKTFHVNLISDVLELLENILLENCLPQEGLKVENVQYVF